MLNASVKRQPDPPLWPGPFYFVQQDSLFYIHFVFISTSSKRWYMKTLFRRSQTDFLFLLLIKESGPWPANGFQVGNWSGFGRLQARDLHVQTSRSYPLGHQRPMYMQYAERKAMLFNGINTSPAEKLRRKLA